MNLVPGIGSSCKEGCIDWNKNQSPLRNRVTVAPGTDVLLYPQEYMAWDGYFQMYFMAESEDLHDPSAGPITCEMPAVGPGRLVGYIGIHRAAGIAPEDLPTRDLWLVWLPASADELQEVVEIDRRAIWKRKVVVSRFDKQLSTAGYYRLYLVHEEYQVLAAMPFDVVRRRAESPSVEAATDGAEPVVPAKVAHRRGNGTPRDSARGGAGVVARAHGYPTTDGQRSVASTGGRS